MTEAVQAPAYPKGYYWDVSDKCWTWLSDDSHFWIWYDEALRNRRGCGVLEPVIRSRQLIHDRRRHGSTPPRLSNGHCSTRMRMPHIDGGVTRWFMGRSCGPSCQSLPGSGDSLPRSCETCPRLMRGLTRKL
eukprot:4418060-Amphidinium_carterae.1